MAQYDAATIAAAELADHYIEIVLSTKPELLVPVLGGIKDSVRIQEGASAIAQFRIGLIQQFSNQPLPLADSED